MPQPLESRNIRFPSRPKWLIIRRGAVVRAERLKPKLLVIELWGLGDLAVATPFLRAAAERYSVTLLAKPHAAELQSRLWPAVNVVTLDAPWTVFRGKYRLLEWSWRALAALRRRLAAEKFDFVLSARWDPRDHLLMQVIGADRRMGFPRAGSAIFLTDPLDQPRHAVHRYDFWRMAGKGLGLELAARDRLPLPPARSGKTVLVHSGARLPARLWPLDRYQVLVRQLRDKGHAVQVACDAQQETWWQHHGESAAVSPRSVTELFGLIDTAGVFIGNCSGPGHLAAISGVPTFTIFGPSLPGEFLPLHPAAEFVEDHACVFRPCRDYCHFAEPRCLWNLLAEPVGLRVQAFVTRHLGN